MSARVRALPLAAAALLLAACGDATSVELCRPRPCASAAPAGAPCCTADGAPGRCAPGPGGDPACGTAP